MANPHPSNSFKKGDPRINRKGKPRSFAKLRELAQMLGSEKAIKPDRTPVIIQDDNGKQHIATQAEMILRDMMHSNPERYLEIAYGKVPQPIEHTGADGNEVIIKVVYDTKP